jgi:hypothetical protein
VGHKLISSDKELLRQKLETGNRNRFSQKETKKTNRESAKQILVVKKSARPDSDL